MKKRKFKLVRSYPNSENVGTIWTKTELGENYWYFTSCLSPADVEGNPEFFEEIIEKQYEILSFICNKDLRSNFISKGAILHKTENGKFEYGIIRDFEERILTLSHWDIHSIRRLSDNEVFSIGDVLIDTSNKSQGSFTLKEIEFESAPIDKGSGKLSFVHTHPILGKWILLEKLEKAKPVLLVTEDSKQIFEDDSYWFVWLSNKAAAQHQKGMVVYGPYHARPLIGEDAWSKDAKHFSSKEAAQEWIILNKPVLSINDVLQHIRQVSKTLDEGSLKEFVKSRL
jgi:hypothetical protein